MWLLTSMGVNATPLWFKRITPKKNIQQPVVFHGNEEEQKIRDKQCETSNFFFVPEGSRSGYRCSDNTHESHWSHLSHYSQSTMH